MSHASSYIRSSEYQKLSGLMEDDISLLMILKLSAYARGWMFSSHSQKNPDHKVL